MKKLKKEPLINGQATRQVVTQLNINIIEENSSKYNKISLGASELDTG